MGILTPGGYWYRTLGLRRDLAGSRCASPRTRRWTKPLRGGNAGQVNGLALKVASPLNDTQVRRPLRRALSTGTPPDHVRACPVLDDRPESGVRKPTERFASNPKGTPRAARASTTSPARKYSPAKFFAFGRSENRQLRWAGPLLPLPGSSNGANSRPTSARGIALKDAHRKAWRRAIGLSIRYTTVVKAALRDAGQEHTPKSTLPLLVCPVTMDSRRQLLSAGSTDFEDSRRNFSSRHQTTEKGRPVAIRHNAPRTCRRHLTTRLAIRQLPHVCVARQREMPRTSAGTLVQRQ